MGITLHASLLEFAITWCYIIIGGFLLRSFMMKYPDSPISKAFAVIY